MDNVADIYPLSPSQEGMLYHTLAAPGSGVYVEQVACTLRGPLRADLFRQAWERAIDRHTVLRTAFLWEGLDAPLQVVRQKVAVPWSTHDWRSLGADVQRERLDTFLREDRAQGFDLAKAPLLRMTLIQTGAETHRFLWSFHHLLLDGWSTALVLDEVLADYAAACQGSATHRPAPPPFRDYIAWLQHLDLEPAAAFWKDRLGGFDTPTPLAVDRPASPSASGPYDQHEVALSGETSDLLTRFARTHRLTLNTIVQGAWAVVLSRYSGERDVVYGTTVAGRPAALAGVETMIGPFISTLPMRVAVSPDEPLVPWLRDVQDRLVEARNYEHTPLAEIQRWSDVRGGRALFDSLVVFENYPLSESAPTAAEGIHVEDVTYREQSNYPLALLVVPGSTVRLIAVYDTARFDAAAIVRLLEHVATVLRAMAASPEGTVGSLPILGAAERAAVLAAAQGPERSAMPAGGVLALIEAQVRRTPNADAVAFGDERLTYADLWQAAGRLAGHLRTRGVGPNAPVGLCIERSLGLVVGVVGILRAGGAYVPLDPSYPDERLELMVDDAGAVVLVTRQRHRARFAEAEVTVIDLDDAFAEAASPSPPTLDDLAYVIYTSGSAGQPKGIAVTHRNLAHSTQARLDTYTEPIGSFLLLSSIAFDSSVAGLFWTLASGGTLVLPPDRLEQDVPALSALIEREGVTHTLSLPSLYRAVLDLARLDHLASLRGVVMAGEALPPDLAAVHYERLPDAALYNEYGPTEATVWATVHPVSRVERGPRVSIGRPIPGTRAYVLDPRGELVPFGVPGELYLGGDGITPGYLRRPDLTAAAFVPDPFGGDPAAQLYRTGDRVRQAPDGTLDFLGRMDNQVKVRGYRIELGEVEAVLRQHPGVREAVATVHSSEDSEDVDEDLDPDDVEALAKRLERLDPSRVERLLAEIGESATTSGPTHAALAASIQDHA